MPSDEEQILIGNLFGEFDEIILLQKRKLNKLKTIKKSMLQKMFPKPGSKVPEIRFKGFDEPWKECFFSEIAETSRGLTYKPSDISKNGVRVLRSSNINEDVFVQYEDDVFVNETAINIPFAQEGDILITSANGSSRLVGKHAIVSALTTKTVHGGFMLLARSDNPYFLNASMSSPWYSKFISVYVAGGNGAIGNLNKNDLDSQQIYVPCKAEKHKIGEFFKQLDKNISNQEQKLDKLKTIKKSMLQKMFV